MKVHILRWESAGVAGKIGGVYTDYARAVHVAEEANLKRKRWRTWLDRMCDGRLSGWIVETFDVKDTEE